MTKLETVYFTKFDTPLGEMWAATSKKGIVQFQSSGGSVDFFRELKNRLNVEPIDDSSKFKNLKIQLDRYFNKENIKFNCQFDLRGTEFQKQVWEAITKIPEGKLSSYGRIAKLIGRPKAVRAVGNAVGSNPIGLIIPCHRVVHNNGTIGGFGGGLPFKRQLLAWEGIFSTPVGQPERGIDLRTFFEE